MRHLSIKAMKKYQIYTLYNETTISPEEQEAISKSKISKENYAQDMKVLEDKLTTLQKSKTSLS